ncbi:MAG: alanine racemase [Lentisphaerae bacterium]|nr:alanine racemase [Lentisphaerota bacterium]
MSAPPLRSWVEIDTSAWRANYRQLAAAVHPSELVPVIKANAYGLGAAEGARAFRAAGARRYAVSCLEEGLQLTVFGLPTLLLGAVLPDEVPAVLQAGLIAPITDMATAGLISRTAERLRRNAVVHLKIDSGMGRLGIPLDQARDLVPEIAALPRVKLEGIFSHFPAAELADAETDTQVSAMGELIRDLEAAGIVFKFRHLANSPGVAHVPAAFRPPFNMVRTGIDLHGHLSADCAPYDLQPAATLKARLVAVRNVPKGATVSYGRHYTVTDLSGEKIGVVAAGYADGYPRHLSGRGTVLVRGTRCPIRGNVCMDFTMVSLQNVPEAEVGDEVVLFGRQGDETLGINEVAEAAGTISYELTCRLGPRVKRIYLNRA